MYLFHKACQGIIIIIIQEDLSIIIIAECIFRKSSSTLDPDHSYDITNPF